MSIQAYKPMQRSLIQTTRKLRAIQKACRTRYNVALAYYPSSCLYTNKSRTYMSAASSAMCCYYPFMVGNAKIFIYSPSTAGFFLSKPMVLADPLTFSQPESFPKENLFTVVLHSILFKET